MDRKSVEIVDMGSDYCNNLRKMMKTEAITEIIRASSFLVIAMGRKGIISKASVAPGLTTYMMLETMKDFAHQLLESAKKIDELEKDKFKS